MIADVILKNVYDAQHERMVRIKTAWDCYHGSYPAPLKPTRSDPLGMDNIRINFAAPLIDKGVSFLLGKEIDFECDAGTEEGPGDLWLDACWLENKQMSLLHLIAMNGGVTGDVFVKLMQPDLVKEKKYPRIVNLDPSTVTPVWNMDDYEDVIGYLVQWNAKDPNTNRPVVRRQIYEPEGNHWIITDQISRGDSLAWVPWGEPVLWPFGWSPITHWQNLPMPNEYFGVSDIEQHVLSVNYACNFVLSNMARIVRAHAHPKTWGTGALAKQIENTPETVIMLPKDSTLQNLEMQSDLGSSLELYKKLKEILHEVSRVPEIATGKVDNIGPLSGVALKILYQSLIEKNQTKQLFYGDGLNCLNERMMEMGKQEKCVVVIHWQDPLPRDVKDEAEAALILEEIGVSTLTVLTEMGYDAEAEAAKKAKEAKTAADLGSTMLDQFDKGQTPGQGGSGDDSGNDDGGDD